MRSSGDRGEGTCTYAPTGSLITENGPTLAKHGLKESEASIANKLARGTFPATFFLATLAALELEGIRLEDI